MNLLLIAFALLGSALMAILDTPTPPTREDSRPSPSRLA